MSELTKITLPESEIPAAWYNIQPDLATPAPPTTSATRSG